MLERTNSKLFFTFLGASAMFIAACAAYFSVRGIALLFSGSMISVTIMAASLEIGKLMSASFLYRLRKTMGIFMKIYLSIAVTILIGITSLGVYGFLSDAFDKTMSKVELYESNIASINNQRDVYLKEIQMIENSANVVDDKANESVERYQKIYDDLVADQRTRQDKLTARIKTMDEAVATIESEPGGLFSSKNKRLKEIKESQLEEREAIKVSMQEIDARLKQEYDIFKQRVEQLRETTEAVPDNTESINTIYAKIREGESEIIKIKEDIRNTDIGSFRFIAESFDMELVDVVKWFILIICLVFDPLAVVLVVGLNMMILDQLTGSKKKESR